MREKNDKLKLFLKNPKININKLYKNIIIIMNMINLLADSYSNKIQTMIIVVI